MSPIDYAALKFIYNPITRLLVRRFGVIPFTPAKHSGLVMVAGYVANVANNLITDLVWGMIGILLFPLIVLYLKSIELEIHRLQRAAMSGTPCTSNHNGWPIRLFFFTLLIIPPWPHLGMIFDIGFLSASWFLMCDPILPKPKRQRTPNGYFSGAR